MAVTVELGKYENRAKQKSQGNLSAYIRQLIKKDLKNQTNKIRFFLYQIIVMFFLSFSMLFFVFSLLFQMMIHVSLLFMGIAGFLVFIDGIYLLFIQKKEVLKLVRI